jgi:hypothetical protein
MTGATSTGFDNTQVTLYSEAGAALASASFRDDGKLENFTFTPINISKGNSVKFTVKLDQVPSYSQANSTLVASVQTGGMIAKNIVSNNNVYPNSTNSVTLTVNSAGTPEVVTQTYTPSLIKYGSTGVELGKISLKANNGNTVMKDVNFYLSGATESEMNLINSIKLVEGTNEITLLKSGAYMYAKNVNQTLTSTPKTYRVVANINTINHSGNAILSIPTLYLEYTGTNFESTYGTPGTKFTSNQKMSNTMRFVNEIPTITAVETYTKGANVVYKVTFDSTKLVEIGEIKFTLNPTNLSGYSSGAATNVYVAGNDTTYTSSYYGSGTTIASGAAGIALSPVANIN